LKFTNYESKTLLELLMIICEDLIPYYSRHSSEKTVMTYRKADVKIKNDAKVLKDSSFYQPIDSDFLIFYYGQHSIFKIDTNEKTCSCRWNISYGTCKHIYK
jgi:hypothetical protein